MIKVGARIHIIGGIHVEQCGTLLLWKTQMPGMATVRLEKDNRQVLVHHQYVHELSDLELLGREGR